MSDNSSTLEVAGYVNKIQIGNKLYKIRAEVTEVYPMTCTKCGAPMKLYHGEGTCDHCGTSFTTMYKVVEAK